MKKLLLLFAMLFAFNANASNIPEGAIVKTANNPDVYIVKYNAGKQYKRLVLNPLVFKSYGHLKWENLLTISDSEMNSFFTSDLVRVDGSNDVYQLVPEGDNGGKYLLTSTQGYDISSIYTINGVDFGNYLGRGNRGARVVQEVSKPASTVDNEAEKIAQQALADAEKKAEAQRQEVAQKAANVAKAVEDQKTLNRLNWGISATSQLTTILKQTDGQMASLLLQINAKKSEIDGLKNNGSLSTADIYNMTAQLTPAYNNLVNQYNTLLEKRNRILTIGDEIDDYVKYGTEIPAADRAYLFALGIDS